MAKRSSHLAAVAPEPEPPVQYEFEGMPVRKQKAVLEASNMLVEGPYKPGTRLRIEVEAIVGDIRHCVNDSARKHYLMAESAEVIEVITEV